LALRARIILGCASGLSNKAVAARERVTVQTVGKWRRRFLERGVDGLLDEPRPGVPRKIDDAKVESIIVQTLESQPCGATHWSTRSMARHSGISTSSVGRIWRAFGLQPHRVETFKLSTDPLFVDKVRDIVGLYLNPPDVPWCSAWMKSPKSRRSTAPSRCCRCGRVKSSGAARSRHDLVIPRLGHCYRPRHRPLLPASPRGRIPQVPDRGRAGRAGRSRHPSRARQLRHP
jgi:transposase